MKIDIGRVFSNTVKMVQQRWLMMIALWAVFFGVMLVYGMVIGGIMGATVMASGAFLDPSMLDNPAAIGGLGIGFIVIGLIFYIGYFAIIFGQQGAMTAMASPMHSINFGEAFQRGLKGGLTFLGVMVLLIIAYLLFALIGVLIGTILSFVGEVAVVILIVLLVPVIIYLACRFSVIVPVIVVDKVFNPITALGRTWKITGGNVLGILLIYFVFAAIAMVVIALPFILLFGATLDPGSTGVGPGIAAGIFAFFYFIVIAVAFTLFSTSMVASLHAEMSDTKTVQLGKTFE